MAYGCSSTSTTCKKRSCQLHRILSQVQHQEMAQMDLHLQHDELHQLRHMQQHQLHQVVQLGQVTHG